MPRMNGYYKAYFELNGTTLEYAISFIQTTFNTKSLWYYHPFGKRGKGPHVHGLVYDHPQTDETIRDKIKSHFSLVTQGSFGISNTYERGTKMSEETIPGYISYMTKGKWDPIHNKGFQDAELTKLKGEWREPLTVHISGDLTVIAKSTRKGKTQFELAKEAYSIYIESCKSMKEEIKTLEGHFNKHRLQAIVTRLCHDNNVSANYRTVANICADACSYLVPGYYSHKIISMF